MQPLRDIIVKVPEAYKESMTLGSGLVIHIHQGLRQVKDTVRYGEVVAVPANCPYDVRVGDTLFFHHGIVGITVTDKIGEVESPYIIDRDKKLYKVPVDMQWHMCYAVERDGEFLALEGNCFVKPITHKKIESSIYIPNNEEEQVGVSEMVYPCKSLEAQGIYKGDKVTYEKDSEYAFFINDEKYYRMFDRWITGKIVEDKQPQ